MNESSFSANIQTNLRRLGVFSKRIENRCEAGTPDLYIRYRGVSAWVENKYIANFPKRADTPVKLSHFTALQKLWLQRHGSGAWLSVQVGDEYFLFDHIAAQYVTGWSGDTWRREAAFHCRKPCDWVEWLKTLTSKETL